MTIKYYYDLIQKTDEWRDARCGLLTASEMELIITPAKLQMTANDKSRNHLNELAAQRVNKYVEPTWYGGDLERGVIDEIDAKNLYRTHYAAVRDCGFVTNDDHGFTLGYSPDGIIEVQDIPGYETPGQLEIKSRAQKYQMETIQANAMPGEFLIQVQTGMIVTGNSWCDFSSYCGGMPIFTHRVHADKTVQDAILTVASVFEKLMAEKLKNWSDRLNDKSLRLIPTERRIISEEITA